VVAWWTDRRGGDQRGVENGPLPPPLPRGTRLCHPRQVHGAAVIVVGAAAPPAAGAWGGTDDATPEADAVVGVGAGAALVMLTADCAPVAMGSPEGVHAAVHVGWRGLVAGVVEAAVGVMRSLGASSVVAGVGATIHPCCYAFSLDHLDEVVAVAGPAARGRTAGGAPALDLPGALRGRLAAADAALVWEDDRCTGCGGPFFSHRVRGDDARQALFVWRGVGAARA